MVISITKASMPSLIVRVEHARAIACPNGSGYCVPGMVKFFERHNLDFKKFVRDGIDADKLLATEDAMAAEVVAQARKEAAGG
jgi:hypothetical protein